MTFHPNQFPVRVLKIRGFDAQDIHEDAWGCPRIGSVAVTDNPGVRLGWNVYNPSTREPRTELERWMGQLSGRGADVELDPESLTVSAGYYVNVFAGKRRNQGRLVVDIEGTGIVPEFHDRAVRVSVSRTMLHAPLAADLRDAPSLNEARLRRIHPRFRG